MGDIQMLLNNELNKLSDVNDFYKKVLNSIDVYKPNLVDHIRNIRHYIDLLHEQIDDLNSYAIMENIPVCKEQIERDQTIHNTKKIFNQFLLYMMTNGNL